MTQQETISAIEDRAKKAGVSVRQLCLKAGLHPTTFSRWKLSERNPEPIGANFGSLMKLETALAEFEQDAAA